MRIIGSDSGDREPTPGQLRKLKAMIPQLKKQAAEHGEKTGSKRKREINEMVDPQPCQICAVVFDAYRRKAGEKEFCSSCMNNLKAGQVVLVTISGRFSFLEAKKESLDAFAAKAELMNFKLVKALGGTILHVKEEFMEKIVQLFKAPTN
jgi:hypothetical protein